ncbi:S-adenosyl-L-methionine-dependent methyltransferase [Mycena sanguinolenta]|uniref:S-adenosyl-L-methionine-dependent methyltransferase n=1 Tax=Mycena sanguinolenta TaxID=230812 RepID=A0A8H6YSD3_9AGAR|nr:S-adenosyl-L-methionine-dependent methyltransferase [Mycena sanguinolenta]
MASGHEDSDNDLRDSFGRGMNTLSEDYKLPADRVEMERLAIQHRVWTLLVGGLYPPTLKTVVDQVLSGPHPTILDAGCGSANWCIEMAELYPNAHIIGADLARNVQQGTPTNFQFIQTDLSEGLPACGDPVGYDLIHSRSFHGHLKDPLAFLHHVDTALKPGGLFIVGNAAKGVFNRDKVQLRPRFPTDEEQNIDGSWMRGWQKLWLDRIFSDILTVDAFLKRSPFSVIFSKNYLCPVGWDGDGFDHGAELGDIMLRNTQQFIRATLPALLADGKFSREELELWIDAIEDEFKNKKLYLNWDLAVGVKRPGTG